jgi:glycine/D-amino acid oxidase-like deaminating enzyme
VNPASPQCVRYDFGIVGQGIAGTMLAWFLRKRQKKVLVIDSHHEGSSTIVAAGLINPITGKRYVKSWRYEELFQFAMETYRSLETELGCPLLDSRGIHWVLKSAAEENAWLARTADPLYREYMLESVPEAISPGILKPPKAGALRGAAQVNLPLLVSGLRRKWAHEGCIIGEKIDFQQLTSGSQEVFYKNYTFEKLIFCEGAAAVRNPFFQFLPFEPSKGEALIIDVDAPKWQTVIKNEIAIIPLPEGTFWAGAYNTWDTDDDSPTPEAYAYLNSKLSETLGVAYRVAGHIAAIRPTVKDRRPLLGAHPDLPQFAIFNGLGTKGGILAPFFAAQMADFLSENTSLDAEVDIRRFG